MTAVEDIDDRFAVPTGEVMTHPLQQPCVCGCAPHDGFCPCGCSIFEPDNGAPTKPGSVLSGRSNVNYTGLYGAERRYSL